jgi:putative MATE family efflux protein
MQNQSDEIQTENVGRLLLKFSIPAVIGMLVNALYSVVDRIFIGRGVGSLALSGVAVTFPITNIIMGIGMLVGVGAGAAVSIKLGQKKIDEAEKILGNAYMLTIIIPIVTSLFGLIFLERILLLFGGSPETLPYAKEFASILIAGSILQNVGFGLNPIIRAEGNPKTAMKTLLIGALINFVTNPIFIFGLQWGVRGSALATILAQAVCSIWIFRYFTHGKSLLKLKWINLWPDLHVIKEILSIGMSPFVMQVAASVVTMIINTNLVKYGGDLAVGAYSMISSIAFLIIMPILGVNQGAQPIIGFNYGARVIGRVKKTLIYGTIVNTCISTIGCLMVNLFPVQIIRLFNTTDAGLIAMGANGLSIFLMLSFTVGAQAAFINYFQSVGKAHYATMMSLLRQVVLLIPLVLVLPRYFGLNGIWMAGSISDVVSFGITTLFITREMRRLNYSGDNDSLRRPREIEEHPECCT